MELLLYSYGSVVRMLAIDSVEFRKSVMIDVDVEKGNVLSVFDAQRKFDADFISSYLNILRESKVGFRLMTGSEDDAALRSRTLSIIEGQVSKYPEILRLLRNCLNWSII